MLSNNKLEKALEKNKLYGAQEFIVDHGISLKSVESPEEVRATP